MTRILVHVEGQTEETFVKEVIAPHLYSCGYHSVGARLLGNSRQRKSRGGIKSWEVVRREIDRHLSSDPGCIATTMVDYYALPNSWPGREDATNMLHELKGNHVAQQLSEDFSEHSPHSDRFEPFVLMHEFEALLFSDCARFASSIGHENKLASLQSIRNQFSTPEHINDSPMTAPSKRVLGIIPGYEKPLYGNIAAIDIGLDTIRQECSHFDSWLSRLEARLL
ncbi:DUF4276 family protein [Novosphingobium sp. MW5]|nr:DUF4276 family protein [Novosphingobium sp. MW5]